MKQDGRAIPVVLILWGVWMLWGFGWQTVVERLLIQVDGTVVTSRHEPSKGAPRYASHYQIKSPDGHLETYIAGATDASLERGLPEGTRIHKDRWSLGYQINEQWVAFPVLFYATVLAIGMLCIGTGVLRWRAWRRAALT